MAYDPSQERSIQDAYGEETLVHPADNLREAVSYDEQRGEIVFPDNSPSGQRTWADIVTRSLAMMAKRIAALSLP